MKISEFLSENLQFLVVKFSIYLNRCVFVMSARQQVGEGGMFIFLLFLYCHSLFLLSPLSIFFLYQLF